MNKEVAKELTKFIQKYSKPYGGTMYSAPMPDEFQGGNGRLDTRYENLRLMSLVYSKVSERELRRKSFTGDVYTIAPGLRVANHLAYTEQSLPVIKDDVDVVYCYQDDQAMKDFLLEQGFHLSVVKVGATSEMLGVYTREEPQQTHKLEDQATLVRIEGLEDTDSLMQEVQAVTGYRDDYPYYNRNNSWQAASLRGFKREDPLYGLKPAEMSRKWLSEHPEEAGLDECVDTTLADTCPNIMGLLDHLREDWFGNGFERVRLLRLSQGALIRHCDITDRDLGTKDGQICRLHIPIITNDKVRSMCWDLWGNIIETTLQPWNVYYMDIRKPHAAVNDSPDQVRIHLQIDVIADDRMREAIKISKQVWE